MIEFIRAWLVGITCAAMIVALCESLAPDGAVRKVVRLAGGLVLLLAIIQPVLRLDTRTMAGILTEYRVKSARYSALPQTENGHIMKAIIEDETAAYILDKAAALEICSCAVTVTAQVQPGQSYPVPETVTVLGNLTQAQQIALTARIEADLAIPAERQTYEREDVE